AVPLAGPGLMAADADHAAVAVAAVGEAGEGEAALRDAAGQRGTALPFALGLAKDVVADDGRVIAGYAHAEAGVGAGVGAVAQDVTHGHHGPAGAAAGGSIGVVE